MLSSPRRRTGLNGYDPVGLEQAFQALLDTIDAPRLPAVQVESVRRFLERVPVLEMLEPYVLELAQRLPALMRGFEPAGVDPEHLRRLLERLQGLRQVDMPPSARGWLQEACDLLVDRCRQAYLYVGELRAAYHVGLDVRGDGVAEPEWLRDDDALTEARPLDRLRGAVEAARRRGEHRPFAEALAAWEERLRSGDGRGTLVVVVRHQGEEIFWLGRLRDVQVDLRQTSVGADDVVANIACVDDDILHRPMQAARAMLARTHPLLAQQHVRGRVRFSERRAAHGGRSAGLALAALYYAAVLRAADRREHMRLAPGVVLTGTVAADGAVAPVDQVTLPAKVEAAFFSPMHTLAVPEEQAGQAREVLAALHDRYPAGHLEVVGVAHVEDVCYDRRLTVLEKMHPVRYAWRRLWRRRQAAVIAVLLAAVGLLALRLAWGPIDREPAGVRFEGTQLHVLNAAGQTIDQMVAFVGDVPDHDGDSNVSKTAVLLDVEGDGREEVIWRVARAGAAGDLLRCKTVGADTLRWERRPRFSFHYPHKPDILTGDLGEISIRRIVGGDLDEDGRSELYVAGAVPGLFPSVMARYDAATGREAGAYHHAGYLEDALAVDLDADGRRELIVLGKNQAFREAALIVLDPRFVRGHGPTAGSYDTNTYGRAVERAYVRIPWTKVGTAFRYATRGNAGVRLALMPTQPPLIRLQINEVDRQAMGAVDDFVFQDRDAFIYLYFDFDLAPSHVATSDPFDFLAEYLYDQGHLDELPGKAYFDTYMQSLRWWDGEAWTAHPAENVHWRKAAEALDGAASSAGQTVR